MTKGVLIGTMVLLSIHCFAAPPEEEEIVQAKVVVSDFNELKRMLDDVSLTQGQCEELMAKLRSKSATSTKKSSMFNPFRKKGPEYRVLANGITEITGDPIFGKLGKAYKVGSLILSGDTRCREDGLSCPSCCSKLGPGSRLPDKDEWRTIGAASKKNDGTYDPYGIPSLTSHSVLQSSDYKKGNLGANMMLVFDSKSGRIRELQPNKLDDGAGCYCVRVGD